MFSENGIRKTITNEYYKKVIKHCTTVDELKMKTWTCPSDDTGFSTVKLEVSLGKSIVPNDVYVYLKGESTHPIDDNTTYRCDIHIQVLREDGSSIFDVPIHKYTFWNTSHTLIVDIPVEGESIMEFQIVLKVTESTCSV